MHRSSVAVATMSWAVSRIAFAALVAFAFCATSLTARAAEGTGLALDLLDRLDLVRHDIDGIPKQLDLVEWEDHYCLPPDKPSKDDEYRFMDSMEESLRQYQSRYNGLRAQLLRLVTNDARALNAVGQRGDVNPQDNQFWQPWQTSLRQTRDALRAKRAQLDAVPVRRCSVPAQQQPVTAPPPPPQGPGIELPAVQVRDVSTPPIPERFCSQEEKDAALAAFQAVAWDYYMNFQDARIYASEIADAIAKGKGNVGVLRGMLPAAQRNRDERGRTLDTFLDAYDRVKAMPVVDCAPPRPQTGTPTDGEGAGLQRSAEDVIDFGGGSRFGGLLAGFEPSLGKPHTGLFTGDLGRVTLGDSKATFTAYGQLNLAFIEVDNGNPVDDNQYVATNAAGPSHLGIGLDYDWRQDFKFGGRLSLTYALNRTDINNDFYDSAGCDEREPERRKFCIYDANLYVDSPTLGRLTLGYQESGFGGLGSINLGGTAFVTNNDPTIKVGNHEVFGTGWQFGQIAPDVTGVTRGAAVRYDSPTLAGFALSGSWGEADHAGAPQDAEQQFWDAALRYAGEFGGFRVAGGLGYQQYDRENDDWNQGNATASASVLHTPTGLYVTGSYSALFRDAPLAVGAGESDTADAFYFQGGIGQTWWPCLGETTLFGETGFSYGGGNAGAFFEDDSKTSNYGIGVVQDIDRAALSIYSTYNRVDGEVGGNDGRDIDVFTFGGRLRF